MTVEVRRAPHAGWRALAATVLVMSGALGAHTWAGGHLPPWPGLVLLGAVVLLSSRLLLDGRLPRVWALPAVVAAQACLHTSFVSLPVPGDAHAGHAVGLGTGAGTEMAMAAASPWSGRMLLAHLSVAVLTLVVWRLCERAALLVVRLIRVPAPVVLGKPVRRPATAAVLPAAASAVVLTAPRRGPPVALRPA